METYLVKRGSGYAFRMAVPAPLRGRFKSSTGRPLSHIVEGLGTDSLRVAQNKAAKRRAHWLSTFERAKQDVPLTLGEIEDAAREFYSMSLARLASDSAVMRELMGGASGRPNDPEADEVAYLNKSLELSENALAELDLEYVKDGIEATERHYGSSIDPASATFATLGRALLRAQVAAKAGRIKALQGEPSEPPATFLGGEGIDTITLKPKALPRPTVPTVDGSGPWALFQRWIAEAKPAASTVNRWRPVFLAGQAKFGNRRISEDEARDWIRGLVTNKRSPDTVSAIWLSSAKTVYGWASEQKHVLDNPFAKVKITVPEKAVTREKSFTEEEAKTILRAASAIEPRGNAFKSAQRWVPWLCAYSGARAGEITQLRAKDIEERRGFWAMKLTPDAGTIKTKQFRVVPLHEHLIAEGFLDFVNSRGNGPLFYNEEKNAKPGSKDDVTNPRRPRPVVIRSQLAGWIRGLGVTDQGIRPNHAWRHTFKQVCERHGISERMSDALTGHAPATIGRGYGAPSVDDMNAALQKFPRYTV